MPMLLRASCPAAPAWDSPIITRTCSRLGPYKWPREVPCAGFRGPDSEQLITTLLPAWECHPPNSATLKHVSTCNHSKTNLNCFFFFHHSLPEVSTLTANIENNAESETYIEDESALPDRHKAVRQFLRAATLAGC